MKSKGRFAKGILVFSFIFVVLYTMVNVVLTYATSVPEPSTLTTCVFAYFSIESVLLMIKKLQGGKENERNYLDASSDNECGSSVGEPDSAVSEGLTDIQESADELCSIVSVANHREPWYIRIFRQPKL